jgi:competence protein ComEC
MKRGYLVIIFILIYFVPYTPFVQAATNDHQSSFKGIWDFVLDKRTTMEMEEMKVHFIDVGQGDSILIETPNGSKMLIDGGVPSKGNEVVSYLKEEGITTIDLLVSTHPDIDHIGGLIRVIEEIKVKKILDSGKLHTTKTYFRYLNKIKQEEIPVQLARTGQRLYLDGNISIKILNKYNFMKTSNQSSLVLLLQYGVIDLLMMGDVGIDQEQRLMDKYNLRSEIIKVAHHGSGTSSSYEFLKEVSPETAILTYGPYNHFGHPVSRVIDNLQQTGATIYSTAKSGNIIITTNGKSYDVEVSGKPHLYEP